MNVCQCPGTSDQCSFPLPEPKQPLTAGRRAETPSPRGHPTSAQRVKPPTNSQAHGAAPPPSDRSGSYAPFAPIRSLGPGILPEPFPVAPQPSAAISLPSVSDRVFTAPTSLVGSRGLSWLWCVCFFNSLFWCCRGVAEELRITSLSGDICLIALFFW